MEKALATEGMRLKGVVCLGSRLPQDVIEYLVERFNPPGRQAVMNGPVLLFDMGPVSDSARQE